MKVIVIGGPGHIGTFLIPMLVNSGFETIYITRGKSKPYIEDPSWEKAHHIILDRNSDKDFVKKIIEMNPDIIVDLICLFCQRITPPLELRELIIILTKLRR